MKFGRISSLNLSRVQNETIIYAELRFTWTLEDVGDEGATCYAWHTIKICFALEHGIFDRKRGVYVHVGYWVLFKILDGNKELVLRFGNRLLKKI